MLVLKYFVFIINELIIHESFWKGYAQAAFDSKQRNQRHQAMATMLEIADEDLKELSEQIRRLKKKILIRLQ